MAELEVSHILHPIRVQELAREWLKEDTPNFDFGGFVVGEKEETAVLLCKSPGVLAGAPLFTAVFDELKCNVKWELSEGSFIDPRIDGPVKVATISGKVRHLLLGERVALNCLTRCSGIASQARRLSQKGLDAKWHGQVAGTRKTTPGFRMVEKYALLIGNMATHRYDLSSMIMLKDNHIWSAGDIPKVRMQCIVCFCGIHLFLTIAGCGSC
jgi:nicotinate-nucleotide pyrophosphorylase (carboxylating)